jgi:hypothetical protein
VLGDTPAACATISSVTTPAGGGATAGVAAVRVRAAAAGLAGVFISVDRN